MSEGAGTRDLVAHRVVDASPEEAWRAWFEPDRVRRWWGPDGFTCPLARMDFRPGGTSLVCMSSPEFGDLYNLWHYRRIVPMERIEYIHSLADAHGNRLDPADLGLPPSFPADQLHSVALRPLAGDRVEVTVTEHGWPPGPMMEVARKGREQCLEKMARLLAGALRHPVDDQLRTPGLKGRGRGGRPLPSTAAGCQRRTTK